MIETAIASIEAVNIETVADTGKETSIKLQTESTLNKGTEFTETQKALKNEVSNEAFNQQAEKVLENTDHKEAFQGALNELKLSFDELALDSPLYENNESRLKWIKRFDGKLEGTEGYNGTKMKTLSKNVHSARGFFAEMARAYRIDEAGLKVKALGKDIKTSLGKTDIDILATNKKNENIWIENKDVKTISLSDDFKLKIEKMADGLERGVQDKDGEIIKINKAIFVNNHEISGKAMEYANSKGIHIKEKMNGRVFRKYIANFN